MTTLLIAAVRVMPQTLSNFSNAVAPVPRVVTTYAVTERRSSEMD